MHSEGQGLSEFVYAVSHDFGRPLRQILAFTDLLKDKHQQDFDDESADWMKYLTLAGQEAQDMLDRLLVYSRLHGRSVEPAEHALLPVCEEILAELGPRYPDRAEDVLLDCTGSARVDRSLLGILLLELVDNALCYSEPGTVKVQLEIGAGKLLCRVSDPGPGIDPAREAAARRPFGRLHPEDPRHVGLGLNITLRALDLMGGELALSRGAESFCATATLEI